ncbi:MAG: DedA family protein [Deltaproteobacteria bacterium]|nr:DedA family protein [Deltaproteobacteria bacterium]
MFGLDPAELLRSYGYIALVAGAFLEGELIVILAGVLAHHGYLSPVPAALCAFGGSVASDQIMFSLGRWKGNAILRRFPGLEKKAPKVRGLLERYETPLILGFRYLYGLRNITPILMGMGRVNRWKFLALNSVSAAVWAPAFIAVGYFFGQAATAFLGKHPYAEASVPVVLVIAAAGVWLWRKHRGTRKRSENHRF